MAKEREISVIPEAVLMTCQSTGGEHMAFVYDNCRVR